MGSYHVEVLRQPYQLSEKDQNEMATLFAEVMSSLAFYATPNFVERLYQTSILIRVRDEVGNLAAFGNVVVRTIAGHKVRHVISMYVLPKHRGKLLMKRALRKWLLQEFFLNWFCIFKPLLITGSAVNPQVYLALSHRFSSWPDLLNNLEPPEWVKQIAEESAARYYPIQTGTPFQVAITNEYAGFRDGMIQRTGLANFDRRFFEYADPASNKLLFFVSEIKFSSFVKAAVQ